MAALSRPAAPDAQPDPLLSFARVVLGDLEFGVDSRCVIRALRRPQRLARLPRSHGAIDGVFVHDGRTKEGEPEQLFGPGFLPGSRK